MNLESIFEHGRYAGQQVEDIIEDHPGYIRFLAETSDVDFDEDVLEALEKREQRRE